MPEVQTELEFLADLPLYHYEKPFLALSAIEKGIGPITNIQLENRVVTIADIRDQTRIFSLDTTGFQIIHHKGCIPEIVDLATQRAYKTECELLLRTVFPDSERVRENIPLNRASFDMNDPLFVDGPARGAHDATVDSGPDIINRYLSAEDKAAYFHEGYRFRIINIWRSLLPVVDDQPLALCDFQSVDAEDLIPVDRVYPHLLGEVYYLRYNQAQRWYWMSKQESAEPFALVSYDTAAPPEAKFCPHISFKNPYAEKDAPPRHSVETRSIVVTRIT